MNDWSQMQIESWVQCEWGEHSLSLWQLKYGDNVQEVNDKFGVWEVNRVCEESVNGLVVNGLVVNQSLIETFVLLIITLWKLLLLLKFWVKITERTEYIITIWYKYCKYFIITNISFVISVNNINININNNNLKK
jgi:hypothetical protein